MKSLKLSLLFAALVISTAGCIKTYKIPKLATWDSIFVGKWEGQTIKRRGGYSIQYEKTRLTDGTYKLILIYYKQNRFLDSKFEIGEWWVHDGVYYEVLPNMMDEPKAFTFEILSNDQIKYTLVKADASADNKPGYSFIDSRTKEIVIPEP